MVQEDKNIGIHKKYIVKEMRIMIYSLFLESYKTVTLECMAEQFGISVGFLDTYPASYKASSRASSVRAGSTARSTRSPDSSRARESTSATSSIRAPSNRGKSSSTGYRNCRESAMFKAWFNYLINLNYI
jgi:hypothetical protein